jgi:hypothetical protein
MNLDPTLDPEEYRMELFLRSLAPPAARTAQETIIDRLKRLDDRGHIREYELTIWGDRIRLDTTPRTPTEETLRDKIDRFRRWERRTDVSLAPGFDEREIDPLVDDAYTVFRPPVIALAVYAGSNVWGVFPCEVDGDPVTVDACLDAFLRRGSLVESRSPGRPHS